MNPNQSTLHVLAREGISVTEGELIRAAGETHPNSNGSAIAPVAVPFQFATLERAPLSASDLISEPNAASASPGATSLAQLPVRRDRQRTPETWVKAILCRLGIHNGPWIYAVEHVCVQSRECGRCGSVHVRTKHQHEWRYIREGACKQVKNCGRCDAAKGERTRHEWGATYDVAGDKEAHDCQRCGKVEKWTVSDGD
ncbi:MAG: hypothetical protein QF744_11145 [SAR202 cluster bacterium]|nr:hypothetical protein [SAR202 cluster bacterium]